MVILTACAPPALVAVEERQTIDRRVEVERIGGTRIRIVQPGDTLHAIAFANRLNVNKLAAWNRLADTSRINIGQRIRLTRPLNFVESAAPSDGVATKKSASKVTARPLSTKSIGSKPLSKSSNTNSSVSVERQASSGSVSNSPLRSSSRQGIDKDGKNKAGKALGKQPVTWRWPMDGKLIGYFSASSGQQGIDIQGEIGQGVLAAGAGQVVYVGNGLKGYGNLVIIKHNDQFLSAYAHNQQLFVQEGQGIETSQRIASLGKDNKQRSALHFQIRKEGQPVNPLSYLPKR